MALVATYGNVSAFNIQIFDMAGGGYYAIIYDASTPVFQRRNAADGADLSIGANSTFTNVLDHFSSYNYDSVNKILTLTGAVTVSQGVTFTRQETYKFVGDYVIEDTYTVVSDIDGGSVANTNWNYYTGAINAVIDIDNTNFGDGASTKPLGIGIQLAALGSFYGCIADNGQNNQNNNEKRALASESGIACTWITPADAGRLSLTQSLNNRTLNLKQWFFKSQNTLRDFMLQAQLAVASAKGYTGTTWQKLAQTTIYLNIYLATNLATISVIPSLNYKNSGMYMRDTFWPSFSLPDATEQQIITLFESKQHATGQLPEHINPAGTPTYHDDESALFYIIRCYYGKTRRGLSFNSAVMTKALTYLASIDDGNGKYLLTGSDSNKTKMWMDGFVFTTSSYCAYSQGLYCVALQCAQKLGFSVTNAQITNAITQYKALYDTTNNFIQFASDKDYISCDVLVGEALNLFLFNNKLLTDAQVINTVKAIRNKAMTPCGAKIVSTSAGAYLQTTEFSPSIAQGDYQNGGSWFLYEYLCYYAALYHQMSDALFFINDRISRELGAENVSHEYLVSASGVSNFLSEPAAHHLYSWNVASLTLKIPNRVHI